MPLRTKLFDGAVIPAQKFVIGFWLVVLGIIIYLWSYTSTGLLAMSLSGGITATGRLFGLLAVFFALTQFMLMGRIAWVEKPFGLDRLARYHRLNGFLAISCIVIHPLLIITGYALASHTNYFRQYIELIKSYPYVWLALIGQVLFIIVVASSIYIVRRKLKFESWYFTHLIAYIAITSVFLHQLAVGGSFISHPLARIFWYALYVFVLLNVLFWRFTKPILNLLSFNFRISKVLLEADNTVSIYIRGRRLDSWPAEAGQFVLVRIFNRKLWWQEHPFSISGLPSKDHFRITVRAVGDYTSMLNDLKPSTRILVSGPYGRFTKAVALTNKRLYIAGGVGITPIRTLAEESVAAGLDSVLIYGNRQLTDTVFKDELAVLAQKNLRMTYVYSGEPNYAGEKGRINTEMIKRLCPDFRDRDIYICGPPALMESLVAGLKSLDVADSRLHFESFSLHN